MRIDLGGIAKGYAVDRGIDILKSRGIAHAMVNAGGGRASAFTADVVSSEQCAAMVAHAESTFGRLDVLFNNAGVMLSADDDAVSTDESVWDRAAVRRG